MNNFNYFAIKYLNDWVEWDKPFINKLKSKVSSEQILGLHDAAKYYKITRNFKKISENRFEGVNNTLKNVRGSITVNNVDKKVLNLSNSLKSIYGKNVISAASKLLWLKYKSPVVIYDQRAFNWLKQKGHKISIGDYATFRDAWLTEYEKERKNIKLACTKLSSVKEYSLAYSYTKKEVSEISSKNWFSERVFDKYAWFNANDS